MPTFRWKGRNASGQSMQGEVSAASHDAVVDQLRRMRIAVTEITADGEPVPLSFGASDRPAPPPSREAPSETLVERLARERAQGGGPRPFRGAAIAAVLIFVAFGVGYFAPIVFVRCERGSGGAVGCTIAERDLGLIPVRSQSLSGVTSVDVESTSETVRVESNRSAWRAYDRLVLANGSGATIRPSIWEQRDERVRLRDGSHTGGEQWLGASTTAMQNTIANFLRNPDGSSVSSWQGQMVPLIFAAIPLLLGLIALVLSVLGLFTGSTNLVYAMAGRAAAAVDERRRRGR